MLNRILVIILIQLFCLNFYSSAQNAQSSPEDNFSITDSLSKEIIASSKKKEHQVSLGIWPWISDQLTIQAEYRSFFKRRLFYSFGVAGFYDNQNPNAENYKYYIITASPAIGVYVPFFKICRFNSSAKLSSYFYRSEGNSLHTPEHYYYESKRNGLFIGPAISLEIIPLKIGIVKLSCFGEMNTAYGFYKAKSFNENPATIYQENDEHYKGWFGSLVFGVNVRF